MFIYLKLQQIYFESLIRYGIFKCIPLWVNSIYILKYYVESVYKFTHAQQAESTKVSWSPVTSVYKMITY